MGKYHYNNCAHISHILFYLQKQNQYTVPVSTNASPLSSKPAVLCPARYCRYLPPPPSTGTIVGIVCGRSWKASRRQSRGRRLCLVRRASLHASKARGPVAFRRPIGAHSSENFVGSLVGSLMLTDCRQTLAHDTPGSFMAIGGHSHTSFLVCVIFPRWSPWSFSLQLISDPGCVYRSMECCFYGKIDIYLSI